MLKFLLAAAPYLLKAPSQTSQKQIARSFTALVLFGLSGMALAAATFIYVTSIYGAALGFITLSIMFLLAGLAMYFKAKRPRRSGGDNLPSPTTSDPIAALVPDAIMKDPAVTKIMNQITSNPIATSVAAAAIGMLITREIMKD